MCCKCRKSKVSAIFYCEFLKRISKFYCFITDYDFCVVLKKTIFAPNLKIKKWQRIEHSQ